jgi:Methylamine utilisation protein MauE
MFHRFAFVRTVIFAGMIAGIALSLPLWRTRLSYPQVPVVDVIPGFPQPIDVVFLLGFVAALGICMWQIRFKRLAVIWLCAAAFLVVQDQSRFQPWFLEYALLFAVVVFSRSETSALVGCRFIVVAVYFWSGLHKMNTSFAAKVFPWLVSPFAKSGPGPIAEVLGALAPFVEMGMAAALLFPKTRRIGVIAILAMHVFLLAVLSPWALGWNNVVGPWNVAMVALVPCLYWNSGDFITAFFTWEQGHAVRRVVLAFVLILPSLSLVGFWDTSPSFALYSGNQMIGAVVLSRDVWLKQDKEMKAIAENVGGRYRIFLDDWSDAAMNVPSYPAQRVLRRVAKTFCSPSIQDKDVAFIIEQPPRWLYRPGWHRIENAEELCR